MRLKKIRNKKSLNELDKKDGYNIFTDIKKTKCKSKKSLQLTKKDLRTAVIGFVLAFSMFLVVIAIVYVDYQVSITAFADNTRTYAPCINQHGNMEFQIMGSKFEIKRPFSKGN